MESPSGLLKIEEAAAYLRLGHSKLYQIIAAGELGPVVRIGRASRLPRRAVEAYVERLAREAADREHVLA